MVKSGLEHRDNSEPKVEPFRLALHFGCAMAIFTIFLNTGLGALGRNNLNLRVPISLGPHIWGLRFLGAAIAATAVSGTRLL